MSISIHALLAESDSGRLAGYDAGNQNFYPRSPCGERRRFPCSYAGQFQISIHALLAESDHQSPPVPRRSRYFYPRSPCGERLLYGPESLAQYVISIHALLAESDMWFICLNTFRPLFLSTLSLRRATCGATGIRRCQENFYPRSPCGERPITASPLPDGGVISIHALLAESDGFSWAFGVSDKEFLSTLSLRRATIRGTKTPAGQGISIHALLAESDLPALASILQLSLFLSTLSLRRATVQIGRCCIYEHISIHALLAESDSPKCVLPWTTSRFLSTLSLRRATRAPS